MDDSARRTDTDVVRISTRVMERLKAHLVKKYGGHIYGKITALLDAAVTEYLDRAEAQEKREKERITASIEIGVVQIVDAKEG